MEVFHQNVKEVVLTFEGPAPEPPTFPGLLQSLRTEQEIRLTLARYNPDIETQLQALNPTETKFIDLSLEDAVTSYLGKQGKRQLFTSTLEEKA